MYRLMEEILWRASQDGVAERERRQRRGEYWLREEATRGLEKTRSERPGVVSRALVRTADFLLSLGLKLRARADSTTPVAIVAVQECIGNQMRVNWCVCPRA